MVVIIWIAGGLQMLKLQFFTFLIGGAFTMRRNLFLSGQKIERPFQVGFERV